MDLVTKFTIDRTVWWRGGVTALLDMGVGTRRQCCLGIYMTACGVPDHDIANCGLPLSTRHADGWLGVSEIVKPFVDANDVRGLPDHDRERLITAAFAQQGITVEFIN